MMIDWLIEHWFDIDKTIDFSFYVLYFLFILYEIE